jgi:3-hydroxyacyl-[acyl-carrier-protein] dehydratase
MTHARAHIEAAIDRLPHGRSFRFLTSVTELDPGVSARGRWTLRGDEPFFEGHFPGNPIVPGVLIAESLAQLAGLIGFAGPSEGNAQPPMNVRLAQVDVKFPGSARPPVMLELSATLVRELGPLRLFNVRAEAAGEPVATGSLTLAAHASGGASP